MASVGHIAVGMAAARVYRDGRVPPWSPMALWSALSLLPDADVIGFALGVQYADPWGHRGATHSLTFSAALGLAIGLAAPRFERPVVRTALMASALLASHAMLDTMTDGGLGCALFWPFDLTRSGMSLVHVERLLGSPPESCWRYTWSPGNRHHRIRMVCFLNARVETVFRRWN